jgi:hypothetical protein
MKIALRILGVPLIMFAVVRLLTTSPPAVLVQTHAETNGSSSIMTVLKISQVIWLPGFAGVILFLVSFIRRKHAI